MNSKNEDKWVLFDWNGTLLNDVEHGYEVLMKLCLDYQVPQFSFAQYLEWVDFPISLLYKRAGFKLNDQEFSDLSDKFMEYYHTTPLPQTFIEVPQILNDLLSNGYKLGIISAYKEERLIKILNDFGLNKYFEIVAGLGNDLAQSKTERFKEVIEQNNILDFVYLGDTLHDREVVVEYQNTPGHQAKSECILISNGHQSAQRLQNSQEDCKVFSSLALWYQTFIGN
jgi:phosphoglycolate phosphatase